MKKAQHAIEGMIVLGVVFLIFFFLFFLYQTKSRDVNLSGKQMGYRDDCQRISNAITNTYMLGGNTVMIVNVKNLNGATITPDSQVIEVNTVSCTFPTAQVSNGVSSAQFSIPFGKTK